MKAVVILGIVLIVLGAVGLIYGGITYTHKKNVVDIGSLQVQVDDTDHIRVPPLASGAVLAAGVVLLFVGRRRTSQGHAV